jgi:hypothetical protein
MNPRFRGDDVRIKTRVASGRIRGQGTAYGVTAGNLVGHLIAARAPLLQLDCRRTCGSTAPARLIRHPIAARRILLQ